LTGSGNNPITLEELQLGPPNQPDLTELLIQINQNIAPQYEDQSGDFLATLDTAQLMSMMSQFANAEAAIQGAYLQPVVQTGTIANYNLDGSPTAGGMAYGTGPALAVSAAGTLGQVLTSAGAGTPTWATPAVGTVTSVSVVSANGLAGTVATATTTPAITLSTTVTGCSRATAPQSAQPPAAPTTPPRPAAPRSCTATVRAGFQRHHRNRRCLCWRHSVSNRLGRHRDQRDRNGTSCVVWWCYASDLNGRCYNER
jgi:hypothetical protein